MQPIFAAAVYLLCFGTSSACAVLLARGYARSGARLLLWSAICFAFLGLNNLLLVVDLLVWPQLDLRSWRLVLSLVGMGVLLFGFIWDQEEA
ncbi:DUF5985 family protein [Sphingomonas sp. BN140010]|uniref:DUF5985 family protein n=1 Tax=Sphingomonas arvum TaxID=2992113 RepID=A0ABT3JFZ4_9SPHN|nr:DUF5985 family protein [Sphingomonas sp. BN140010]MCW3797924.1 DUF5985 family protein [Sphingomonas sp. BN140010]